MTNRLIKQVKLSDLVVDQLRKDITTGKYKDGEKIPTEPELMKQFGVGRSTIREAITTLSNSGLLSVQQGSGTFVNTASTLSEPLEQRLQRAGKDDILELASLLQTEIVKKTIYHHNRNDMMQLKSSLEARAKIMGAAANDDIINADKVFHRALGTACHNELLSDIYYSFTIALQQLPAVKLNPEKIAANQKLMEQLVQAIADKNEVLSVAMVQLLFKNSF